MRVSYRWFNWGKFRHIYLIPTVMLGHYRSEYTQRLKFVALHFYFLKFSGYIEFERYTL
jgi:hypothetical protein